MLDPDTALDPLPARSFGLRPAGKPLSAHARKRAWRAVRASITRFRVTRFPDHSATIAQDFLDNLVLENSNKTMTVFANVDDLKEAILGRAPEEFFDEFVVGRETVHFDGDKLDFVSETLQEEYGVAPNREQLVVVGSSKLGFALHSKRKEGAEVAPAFRKFGVDSDIDLSICCPDLFDLLWHEISAFMCTRRHMPYRSRDLGNYLSYGWLRTDHLPNAPTPHLIRCDNLRFAQGKIRKDRQRGHPKLNFGIFHDLEHLKLYQARSINVCRQTLENPL